jgi:DNA-binding Lrp family transcriptional regulator
MENNFKKKLKNPCAVIVYREVIAIKELSHLDKMILSKIIALDNDKNCVASNGFIAEEVGTLPESVSRSIRKLKKLGYVEIHYNVPEQRILKSKLSSKIKASIESYQNDKRS